MSDGAFLHLRQTATPNGNAQHGGVLFYFKTDGKAYTKIDGVEALLTSGLAPLASPAFTGDPTAPTPATSDNDTSIATTAFVKAALLAAHPVGDIKMTTANVNPGTYLGGTWVAWGTGQVPVGVDTGQTEFNTVEKTGGEKTHLLTTAEMPAHTHGLTQVKFSTNYTTTGSSVGLNGSGTAITQISDSTGGGGAHNNLQPYITCYMWKRTA